MAFSAIYFIQNDAGTYRAFDSDGVEQYSGTSLVTNVLNQIESAHAGNFAIFFGIGTFDMGTENWTLNTESDILIAGSGIDATIVQNNSSAAADTEPFSFTSCDRITIRDMTIVAAGSARSTSDALDFDAGDNCLVERIKITNSRGRGIVFDGKDGTLSRENTVRDCIIQGCDLSGIELLAADRNLITGNRIFSNGESGIKVNRDTSPAQASVNNIIKDNHIYSNVEAGIEVLEAEGTIIEGNVIYDNGTGAGTYDDGIVLDDFATAGIDCSDTIIKGNILTTVGATTQDRAININDAAVLRTIIEGNVIGTHVQTDEAVIQDLAADTIIRNNQGYPDKIALEVSAAYTLTINDPPILNVDTSGGAVTITLPDNAAATGKSYLIRRDGGSNVTINRAGSDTFDDAATSKTLGADSSSIGIYSIGDTEWKIVATEGTVT